VYVCVCVCVNVCIYHECVRVCGVSYMSASDVYGQIPLHFAAFNVCVFVCLCVCVFVCLCVCVFVCVYT